LPLIFPEAPVCCQIEAFEECKELFGFGFEVPPESLAISKLKSGLAFEARIQFWNFRLALKDSD
jgi:hypothetical protein